MAKPKLPVMIDLETLSLRPNAAVIDIAMCAATDDGVMRRWLVKPESYTNNFDFDVCPDTLAFHHKQNSGLVSQAAYQGIHWRAAADEVVSHLRTLGSTYEIHLWAKGKDADIPWLSNLLQCAGHKAPWKYSNTHCLRDLQQLFSEVPQTTWGNHTAAKDVEAQIKSLKDIAAHSDRAYRFIYGD